MKTVKGIVARLTSREPKKLLLGQIAECAKSCISSPAGRVLIDHLVDEFGLDTPNGCKTSDEQMYESGQQDVVKYILGLISE